MSLVLVCLLGVVWFCEGYFFWSFLGFVLVVSFGSFLVGVSGTNFRTMPLMQYLWFVGVLKPSPLNRWPRWASHFAHSTSVRMVPCERSILVVTFSAFAGS